MKAQRNLWPAGVAFAITAFAAATAGLIALCGQNAMELVSSDYYEQEIAFQEQAERVERTKELEEPIAVRFHPEAREVVVTLPSVHRAANPSGAIHFYRPSAARWDRRFKLECDSNGRQAVDASSMPAGLWKIQVSWSVAGDEYFHEQPLIFPAGSKGQGSPRLEAPRGQGADPG